MAKLNDEGKKTRPRKAKELAERKEAEAQAFRVLESLAEASVKYKTHWPPGSTNWEVTQDLADLMPVLVKVTRAIATQNPYGSEREQQSRVWQAMVAHRMGVINDQGEYQ